MFQKQLINIPRAVGKRWATPEEAFSYWEQQRALEHIEVLPGPTEPEIDVCAVGSSIDIPGQNGDLTAIAQPSIPTQNPWPTAKAFVVFRGTAPGPYLKWCVYLKNYVPECLLTR
jgi:hypothetical protein